jgi:hypothetical protein
LSKPVGASTREDVDVPTQASSRAKPWPAEWTVREARDAYLAENGFTLAAYDEPTSEIKVLGVSVHIPNTKDRQVAVRLHDLHHAVTGYGTDFRGEWEISAWELRKGLRGLGFYVRMIVTFGALTGLVLAPIRTVRAWRSSDARPSLFATRGKGYEALLEMTLGQLRARLGVPESGIADRQRGLHGGAPSGHGTSIES